MLVFIMLTHARSDVGWNFYDENSTLVGWTYYNSLSMANPRLGASYGRVICDNLQYVTLKQFLNDAKKLLMSADYDKLVGC